MDNTNNPAGKPVPQRRVPPPRARRTEADDDVNVKPLTLSKADIAAFRKAVKHRVGRTAYEGWRVISGVYKKASDMALEESGQESRNNPLYKRAFSRIIGELSPIANTEGTTRVYRAALLNIEDAEPRFTRWYEKHEPCASNPVDLWNAFKAFDEGGKKKAAEPTERTFTKHQRELARVREEDAVKIAELTDRIAELETGKPAETATWKDLLLRAWRSARREYSADGALEGLLVELLKIASDHAATVTPEAIQGCAAVYFDADEDEADDDVDAA